MAFAGAIGNQLDLIGQFELTAGVVTRLLLPLDSGRRLTRNIVSDARNT